MKCRNKGKKKKLSKIIRRVKSNLRKIKEMKGHFIAR